MNLLKPVLITLTMATVQPGSLAANETDAATHAHEEAAAVRLDADQQQAAGIQVETLEPHKLPSVVQAPGEIRRNAYASSIVTPRIAAQVSARQAKLGEIVTKGQTLVRLSSVEMAQAQGDLLVAEREWTRVRKLGKRVVSEQRYTKARVERELARARVLSFGMSEAELKRLLRGQRPADGQFDLLAPQQGTVVRDDFITGEWVEPGRVLFEISDESRLWVETRLPPQQAAQIAVGAAATVSAGEQRSSAKVIQIHHALDEHTRTLGVRLALANPDDRFHPGMFVETRIETRRQETGLAVPVDAVMRSPDGDWQVFIEHQPGEFEPREVEVLHNTGGLAVIRGIEPGVRVVTHGAFFLQSELAKSGFEIHNH